MAHKPEPVIQIAYMILGKVILILVAMQLGILQFSSVIILVMFVLRWITSSTRGHDLG